MAERHWTHEKWIVLMSVDSFPEFENNSILSQKRKMLDNLVAAQSDAFQASFRQCRNEALAIVEPYCDQWKRMGEASLRLSYLETFKVETLQPLVLLAIGSVLMYFGLISAAAVMYSLMAYFVIKNKIDHIDLSRQLEDAFKGEKYFSYRWQSTGAGGSLIYFKSYQDAIDGLNKQRPVVLERERFIAVWEQQANEWLNTEYTILTNLVPFETLHQRALEQKFKWKVDLEEPQQVFLERIKTGDI